MVPALGLSTLGGISAPVKGVSTAASFEPKLSRAVISKVAFLEVILTSEMRSNGHCAASHANPVRRFFFKIVLDVSPFY